MDEATNRERASKWGLSLPASYWQTLHTLGAQDEVGFWTFAEDALDPSVLTPGCPVNLYPVADNGMGDFLCFYPSLAADEANPKLVMWNGETNRITTVGSDFAAFLPAEMTSRMEFLRERGAVLSADQAAAITAGQPIALQAANDDARLYEELLVDAWRVANKLNLADAVRGLALGEQAVIDRTVNVKNDAEMTSAIDEFRQQADAGDGAAALEVFGFHHLAQDMDKATEWAWKLSRCPLHTWPDYSEDKLTGVTDYIRQQGAKLAPAERLDPLFAFLTGQPVGKPGARLTLAKQYLRKKDLAGAIREAQNALFLARRAEDGAGDLKAGYAFLIEVFAGANRLREKAFCELLAAKL